MKKTKKQSLIVRREVEDHLFQVGLSQQDVANVLNIDRGSATNDYRHLGGLVKYRSPEINSKQRHAETYGKALKKFASLYKTNLETEVYRQLYKALDMFLEIQRLRDISKGVAVIIQKMINPKEAPEYEPYRKMLNAIFGTRENTSADAIYFSYLEYLTNSTRDLPNRDSVHEHMADWAYTEYENYFAVPLGQPIKKAMEKALETLGDREQKILRLRYGLDDGFEKSLEEISKIFGITRERIRQIEARAFRRLRNPSRSKELRLFVRPVTEIAEQFLEEHFFPSSLLLDPPLTLPLSEPENIPENDSNLVLNKHIVELDLSVRTYNCLINRYVNTVGDLVILTEAELLRTRNFGRKCLNEIIEILTGFGLCLGMKMNEEGNLVPPGINELQVPQEISEYLH